MKFNFINESKSTKAASDIDVSITKCTIGSKNSQKVYGIYISISRSVFNMYFKSLPYCNIGIADGNDSIMGFMPCEKGFLKIQKINNNGRVSIVINGNRLNNIDEWIGSYDIQFDCESKIPFINKETKKGN